MSITWKVIKNVHGLTIIGRSTSVITILFNPSKALTTNVLAFMEVLIVFSFPRVFLGRTFRDELVSTNTLERRLS